MSASKATDPQRAAESLPKARRRWWQWARRAFILYALIPYFSVTMLFFVIQRKLIYRPTVAESLHWADIGPQSDLTGDVQIQTPDGDTLRGWLLKSSRKRDGEMKPPLVVYFPGNAMNRHERIADLREVAACGFDVLIFDYRGYGDSSGSPSERKLTLDARLVWEYACKDLEYEESRTIIFGESLGGAVALSLWSSESAKHPRPAALILNSTFASLPQTVGWHYPLFPFQYLLLDRWSSIDRITQVRAPIVVLHGTADDFVPLAHGRELAEASANAQFIEIPGAGHNDIPIHRLRTELDRFRVPLE